MSWNETNTTANTTTTGDSFSWSAVGFLIFVAIIFIISVILILYFEKVCCFARYRFIKHLLRRINRTKKSQPTSTTIQSIATTSINKFEDKNRTSSQQNPEYLWIAGQCEHRTAFQPSALLDTNEFSTDLPDDDYTTLVPPIKQINNSERKLPAIPIIIEHKENDSSTKKVKRLNSKSNYQQNTTITRVSRRQSSVDPDSIGYIHSAPSSPALLYSAKRRSNHNHSLKDQFNVDRKSISNDPSPVLSNVPSSSFKSGALEIRLKFDAKNSKMWVFIIKATLEIDQCVLKQTLVQIHLTMLPNKRIRFRTQAKPADNAMFAEEFFCKVAPESIQTQGIRFRLYINKRFKREKLAAEATVMFGLINLDEDMCKMITLEPVYSSDDSELASSHSHTSSNSQSRQDSLIPSGEPMSSLLPELEIGLAYDKNQSILIFEIGKGINFGMTSQGRAPDTYVQLTLLNSSGEEMASNRTVTRRHQHHPVFAERYPFNIEENLLNQITIVVTIINKKPTGKYDRSLGWISFGHGVSGNSQVAHWDSMLNAHGETITRWHTLLES
ncbi:unnamed protein product [Rotaria sordida]|uniref:C2 domain-containing protein n=1 Tax=Rotaria sordida TaxID=392033 RepID=A0A818JIU7_9BILA|nr:unnamed protein product [Rotaria sordida]CAF3544923.1 unnamed protein product [Rotaria sordida]